ncbi:MAG: topology modulation protein [Novosphingobium sp.]
MQRILLVGCPGAGKSTAARKLAEITGLPLIHLDRHYWQSGWVRPDRDLWHAKVAELADQPRWIMDGNYSNTLYLRLAAADTLIHLDFSTAVCAWRVGRRMLMGLGQNRGQEFGKGCPERLNWPFFRFVLNYRRKYRARDLERMASFGGTMHRFTSPAALEVYLSGLAENAQYL